MFLLKRRNFAKCGYTGWQETRSLSAFFPHLVNKTIKKERQAVILIVAINAKLTE